MLCYTVLIGYLLIYPYSFLKDFISLFLEREGKGGREKERNTNM